jgi:nicotinamidase-related amidase
MRSALLVMDMQNGILGRIDPDGTVLGSAVTAAAAARDAGVPVVFVRVAFRPGYPEVSGHNRAFSTLRDTMGTAMTLHAEQTQVHADLAPRPDEPVVVKKRVSAFAGSDLDMVLRALGVGHLVLTGVATGGVVLSTVREAADRDFRLTVLADACADADPEVHRALVDKVFPRQAEVTTVAAWAATLAD